MRNRKHEVFLLFILFLFWNQSVFASSDDGFSIRLNDMHIEVRINIGDTNYAALFNGIAREDNLLFSLMRWAKTYEDKLGSGERHLMMYVSSDKSGTVKITVMENERLENHIYPHALTKYDESFFIDLVNKWIGITETRDLVHEVSLIIVKPLGSKYFTDNVTYTDIFTGALPGYCMYGKDGVSFIACFYYKSIDLLLSNHRNTEFLIKKIVVNKDSIADFF